MSDIRVHPTDNKLIAWPHRVIDNFFSEEELSWINGQFEYGLKHLKKHYWPLFDNAGQMLEAKELLKKAHEHKILYPTTATNGFSLFVPFWSTERYIEVIDELWKESSKIYPWERNNDIRRKDYFCFLELNIYPPKLNYNWHVDINYKTFTGVIYIGKEGDGTTLKSGSNELDVVWKDNRGLMFMNCDKERRAARLKGDKYTSVHRYKNSTPNTRFAINMNIVHTDNIGQIIKNGVLDADLLQFHWKTKNRPFRKFKPIVLNLTIKEKK